MFTAIGNGSNAPTTHPWLQRPILWSIGLVFREHLPLPLPPVRGSAAARVPFEGAAPRGTTPDPPTRGCPLNAACQAPGDLNANALPPMSPPVHRRPVRQVSLRQCSATFTASCRKSSASVPHAPPTSKANGTRVAAVLQPVSLSRF